MGPTSGTGRRPPALDEATLADVATNLWRARKKIAQSAELDSRAARQADRFLGSIEDDLALAGVVVQDHAGRPIGPGMPVEILIYAPQPDLERETVVETVRPSVLLNGRPIQTSQVIVGQPVDPTPTATDE
uniref:hypothetical protein n=1 Tax=Amycolatopsis sp. CA-096443 TaxID=3239919 RepID=UPI003F4964D8